MHRYRCIVQHASVTVSRSGARNASKCKLICLNLNNWIAFHNSHTINVLNNYHFQEDQGYSHCFIQMKKFVKVTS